MEPLDDSSSHVLATYNICCDEVGNIKKKLADSRSKPEGERLSEGKQAKLEFRQNDLQNRVIPKLRQKLQ
ncbi:MAG: hypothetical protein PHF44_00395 [Candidatus Pacebacteria bacterium]|nr:hypothetical protein [Candidatus Paceibacterota bacterium]